MKRKGYELGEQIGTFYITAITPRYVTLDDKEGSVYVINLNTRDPKKKIKRIGNLLYHKGKRLKTAVPVKAAQAEVNPAAPVTKAELSPTAPAHAINMPRMGAFICGAKTIGKGAVKSPGQLLFERVSGAKTKSPKQ